MSSTPSLPLAKLDRRVLSSDAADGAGAPMQISGLAAAKRWVLLGEPGSGKSTTFEQAAAAHGTEVVTARRFVAGVRPTGPVVFVDALEEFRIGEAGHDRLDDLTDQLASSGYAGWRLTCRSASLSQADLLHLEAALGAFDRWNLGPLEQHEQLAVLQSLGEADPAAVLRRVNNFAAAPLMGNPATLKLLHGTLSDTTARIESRGALFAQATDDMAHEVNTRRRTRKDRSTPGAIIAAAEKACLVLMLSARTDLWMGATRPPRADLVTKDELIPSGVDTQALHDAVDTPMFRGEADSYTPTHRMVAEYLAGRALAGAVSSRDGRPPALGFDRAYALLCGDDEQPSPALLGTFAWFVTSLADGVHAERALDLVKAHPEAILFQGDAAMLPLPHRQALLEATGQGDPWFLSGGRGSTAIGGLAGPDLEVEFRNILRDPAESTHRRAMILEALTAGRRIPGLDAEVRALASDPSQPRWLRREAIGTIQSRSQNPLTDLRAVVVELDREATATAISVKLPALAHLVGHDVTAHEARKALADYADTGDGVMGYAYGFGEALARTPIPNLFDAPVRSQRRVGQARSYEINGVIARVLAQLIITTARLTPGGLLRWLANCGFKRVSEPESELRDAIQDWVDKAPPNASRLFWELYRQARDYPWTALYEYQRLTGRHLPDAISDEAIDRLATLPPGPDAAKMARTAVNLILPFEPEDNRYWRLWDLLDGRADLAEIFEALTQSPIDHWRSRETARKRESAAKTAEALAKDRAWLAPNLERVRDGSAFNALRFAAEIYAGYHPDRTSGTAGERLVNWVGEPIADAIIEGWAAFMTRFPLTWREQARQEGKNKNYQANYIAAAYADHILRQGETASDLSLDAAFAVLRGQYVLQNSDHRDAVQAMAVHRVRDHPDGLKTLVEYWRTALRPGMQELPHARTFEEARAVDEALRVFLKARPNIDPDILRSAIGMAARVLPLTEVAALIASALKRKLKLEARAVWTFAAFLIDPARHQAEFAAQVAALAPEATRLPHGQLISEFDNLTRSRTARRLAFARHLGPRHPPSENSFADRDNLSGVVAASIKGLGETPTAEATEALDDLLAQPNLKPWNDTLRHYASVQLTLRQQAEFRPPAPRKVAEAIAAGPPATAADLRAVVRECLADLGRDIRDGDTAGWKAFWNRPGDGDFRSPREENDCRDLLLDRLRDRLVRFGIPANRATPEARRRNDRRADVLLIGEEAANLPVEAKRHMHRDLWTAAGSQLKDYGRSPGSGGHGVYLVFWFGPGVGPMPAPPKKSPKIETASYLEAALTSHLRPELRALTDVIVIDVSPPPTRKPTTSSKSKSPTPSPTQAANAATGPTSRTRARKGRQ